MGIQQTRKSKLNKLYTVACIFTFVASLMLLPVLLPVILLLLAYNCCICLLIRVKGATSLPADDVVWQQDRATNLHIVSAVVFLEGQSTVEKLREIVAKRLVNFKRENGEKLCPRLTCRIDTMYGQYVWIEDAQFNIEKHVKLWQERKPTTTSELQEVVSKICSLPLTYEMPLWEFILVPTPDLDNSHCFVFRIHHSYADGIALTRLFVNNLFDVPVRDYEPIRFSTKQRLLMWCKAALVGPMTVLTKCFSPADNSEIHGGALNGKRIVAWSKKFSLATVKEMKNQTKTTVNDVMTSCLSGALRRYLQDHTDKKPQDIWAAVPVDVRADKKSMKFVNKFALVFLRAPVGVEGNMEQLIETKTRMDEIKKSAEPFVAASTVRLLMLLPHFISKPILDIFSYKMSCVLSNVPGPQLTLTIGGNKAIGGVFWPPARANIAIMMSIFSYNGHINIGVMSDEAVISQPKEIVANFEKHFDELCETMNIKQNKIE
ncbi:uncharacterized protein LOC114524493 [Dendronephthya gigantea]|uniref:uncharacterized protein LOC114524493 n=1 Tax=Dendronephthya gigantea TaxID=151771 RepID=UPI00106D5C0F|nr:uncharacterized protein LOC114524493 [Dendronephthya gigantea]